MNDHVAVVNAALVKLGEKPITSMDDQVKAAELAKLRYDSIRQSALTMHTWHFAKDRLALTPLSSIPAFGFAYQFERPSQCLRILSTGGVPYKLEGSRILCDSNVLYLEFTKDVTNPQDWTIYFAEVVVALLAKELAWAITQSDSMKSDMNSEFDKTLKRAKYLNATEGGQTQISSELFFDARHNRSVDSYRE